ncbi:MAG: Ig-like domain-containing protein [Lachnospiraceae bacterium]|nr:Ig-like domain-containing protein [Lachnospiraceae bacterium]
MTTNISGASIKVLSGSEIVTKATAAASETAIKTEKLPEGTYIVTVSKEGYDTVTESVTVKGDATLYVTLVETKLNVVSVSAVNPTTNEESDVFKANSLVKVKLSGDIDPVTANSSNVYLTKDGVKQLSTVTFDAKNKAVTLSPATVLDQGKEYTLTIKNLKTKIGNTVETYTTKISVANNVVVLSGLYSSTKDNNNNSNYDTSISGGNVNDNNEKIQFTFSADMDKNTVNTTTVKLYDVTDDKYIDLGSNDVFVWKNADNSASTTNSFQLKTPADALKDKHLYKLTLSKNIADLAGNTLGEDYVATFYCNGEAPEYKNSTIKIGGEECGNVDTTPAVLDAIYPKLEAGMGYSGFNIQLQIDNKVLNTDTINNANIVLAEKNSGETVPVKISYEKGSGVIMIVPEKDLKELTTYTLTVKNVKDVDGISLPDLADAKTVQFTTADVTRPTIVSTTPANADENVAIDAGITINFSEKMKEATLTPDDNIELIDVSDKNEHFSLANWNITLSEDGKTLTLKPKSEAELKPNRTYKLTLKKNAIADANGVELGDDYKVLFTTANTATTKLSKVQLGGVSDNDKEVKNNDTNVGNDKDLYFTLSGALKDKTGNYDFKNNVKVERYVAESGIWKTIGVDATAAQDTFGLTLIGDKKTLVFDCPSSWKEDTDTSIDEENSSYNNKLIKDTKYRITLTSGLKDVNDNPVESTVFEFTTGTKPTVDKDKSYPAPFAKDISKKITYIPVVIGDDESDLLSSTMKSENITLTNKATGEAAPFDIAYVQNKKKQVENAAGTATSKNTSEEKDDNDYKLEVTDVANFKIGKIITLADFTGAFVVTDVDSAENEITVDRKVNGVVSKTVTFEQGVVLKVNQDKSLEDSTEYLVSVKGVKDIAGNVVDDASYTFRTTKSDVDFNFVSATISDGQTGVKVNQPLEFTYNDDVKSDSLTGNVTVDDGTDVTAKFDITVDGAKIKVAPKGFLKANTEYTIKLTNGIAQKDDATDYADEKTFKFQTEITASVKPQIVSAVYYDLGTAGVDAGDKIKVDFNVPVDETNLDALDDFEFGGTGIEDLKSSSVTLSDDKKSAIIDLAGDNIVLAPGISTIKISKSGSSNAKWTDVIGNDFTTDAVVIKKSN